MEGRILSTYVLGIETERGRFIDEASSIPKVRLLPHCTYVHSQQLLMFVVGVGVFICEGEF